MNNFDRIGKKSESVLQKRFHIENIVDTTAEGGVGSIYIVDSDEKSGGFGGVHIDKEGLKLAEKILQKSCFNLERNGPNWKKSFLRQYMVYINIQK